MTKRIIPDSLILREIKKKYCNIRNDCYRIYVYNGYLHFPSTISIHYSSFHRLHQFTLEKRISILERYVTL